MCRRTRRWAIGGHSMKRVDAGIRIRLLVMCVMVIAIAAPLAAPHAAQQTAPADPWKERLESLRPDQPARYFDVAEEMADAATTIEQKNLARQLFSLAAALDSKHLGRSACLALADLEESPNLKRRLLALAALLDPSGASAASISGGAERTVEVTSAAALAVSEALSRYRHGQGAQALS